MLQTYILTVFDQTGEKLLDDSFTAETLEEAKKIGTRKLFEGNYHEQTHRCVAPNGKLVLFHR